ncbi:MAG: TraB/GumN family protein [Methanobacteriota archaeon]
MLRKVGDHLIIIGVAHVLPRSAAEVGEIIAAERPDIVAVELDPFRYLAMTQGKKPGILDAFRTGPNILLLSALIYLTQGKFSRQTGMQAGEEMLVAVNKAKEIGAQVQLIDRDIGITLQRLVSKMTTREKFRLFGNLLIGLLPVGKGVEIEHITEEQMVESLLVEFRKLSAAAYDVLIAERDSHMSSRLATFLLAGKKVVCVVGAGHVPGIYEKMSKLIAGGWRMRFDYRAGG